jgi:hypothetical protein
LVIALTLLLSADRAIAGNGNGLPPGPRFMLNVIAYDADHCPSGDFTGSNRHMIAVQADFTPDGSGDLTTTQAGKDKNLIIRNNTIKLTKGSDIQVLDGNACSKGGAELMLPADPYRCDADGDGAVDEQAVDDPACIDQDLSFQEYRVLVRLVGRLDTAIGVTTCASENTQDLDGDGVADGIDVDGDGVVGDTVMCSTENVVKIRSRGSRFEDVTRELLTLCLDTLDDGNLDGACDFRYGIFDPALIDAFWQWNTQGKAHAQLVFVPIPD